MKTLHGICHYHDGNLLLTNPGNDDARHGAHLSYINSPEYLHVFHNLSYHHNYYNQSKSSLLYTLTRETILRATISQKTFQIYSSPHLQHEDHHLHHSWSRVA